jgi:hypothetical protein
MPPSFGVRKPLRAAGALVFGAGTVLMPMVSLEQAPETHIKSTLTAEDTPVLSPLKSEVLGNVAVGLCNSWLLNQPRSLVCDSQGNMIIDGLSLPTPAVDKKAQSLPVARAQVTTTTEAPTTTTTEAPTTTTTTAPAAVPNAANPSGVTSEQYK